MKFIAKSKAGLCGKNDFEAGQVDQWIDFSANEMDPVVKALIMPILGYTEQSVAIKKRATTDLFAFLRTLDVHFKNAPFMVGGALTIADLAIYSQLKLVWELIMEDKVRKGLQNLTKWINQVANIKEVQMTFGKLRDCKKEFPPLVKAQEEKKKPEEKKKAEPKKKEPKKQTKKEKEDDDDDIVIVGEKKQKNPLDLLPPTAFDMDEFKRLYVNAENKEDAFNQFLEKFDEQGYSLWHLAYQKYKGEGEVLFHTNNLMNGFLQRLESFRKYAFAVHGVYGNEPDLEIRGVWLWRGTDIPQEMKEAPSFEFHTVKKLDIKKNPDHLKLLEQYWLNLDAEKEPQVEGLTARTVKYFK
eukprot:TRINITY_DN18_c0_g1_i2.p1 TRINITY_DN18_c0_g1~~TRINITY_DN18_c0_g1_i2.p1  ORF type:complete len:355 (-),score=72.93 TRINITY_DN18_c0_g1_i2:75-1139(-)